MGCHFVTRPFGRCLLIASVFVAPLAHGDTEVIFAAENALYGAGYDIGKADGWMDSPLRTAIRQYQSDTPELSVSGELDAATLAALGTRARPDSPVSSNSLGSRQAALAKLDLPVPVAAKTPDPSASPSRAANNPPAMEAAERTRAPAGSEPEAQPVLVAAIEQESEVEMAQETNLQPDINRESQLTTPTPARTPTVESDASAEPPTVVVTNPAPPTPTDVSGPVEPVPVEPEVVTGDPDSLDSDINGETTMAGAPDPVPAQSPAPVEEPPAVSEPVASSPYSEPSMPVQPATPRSTGGFFSTLFDFLFGWLV